MASIPDQENKHHLAVSTGNPELAAALEIKNGPVFSLAWSPDGRQLASSSFALVKVWEVAGKAEIASLEGHSHFIWGLAWSPDGTQLASASQDGSVKLWDADSWQSPATLPSGGWSFCACWSPESKRLAAGTGAVSDPARPEALTGELQIWDIEANQVVCTSNVPSFILSTDWAPDGELVATGCLDGRVLIWDGKTGTLQKSLVATSERSDVNGLAWSPDGKTLATAQQDGKARLWDWVTGRIMKIFEASEGWLRGITWSPDGQMLAAAGLDGNIRIWGVNDGALQGCLQTGADPIWSLAWSPDGKWLAAGSGRFEESLHDANLFIYRL